MSPDDPDRSWSDLGPLESILNISWNRVDIARAGPKIIVYSPVSPNTETSIMYRVTKLFTSGLLAGITYTFDTDVKFELGRDYHGFSSGYKVIAIELMPKA